MSTRLPRLPDHVMVLSRRYKVKRVSRATLEKEHGGDCYADCCPQDCTIRIGRGVSLEAAWGYFEHECGHALIFELGLQPKIETELEEAIVEQLLPAWLAIVRPRKTK